MFNRKKLNTSSFNPVLLINGVGSLAGVGSAEAQAKLKMLSSTSVSVSSNSNAKSSVIKSGKSLSNVNAEVYAQPTRVLDGLGALAIVNSDYLSRGSVVKMVGVAASYVSSQSSSDNFLFSWGSNPNNEVFWGEKELVDNRWVLVERNRKDWRVKNA